MKKKLCVGMGIIFIVLLAIAPGIQHIKANEAWESGFTEEGVNISVLGTVSLITMESLTGRM